MSVFIIMKYLYIFRHRQYWKYVKILNLKIKIHYNHFVNILSCIELPIDQL